MALGPRIWDRLAECGSTEAAGLSAVLLLKKELAAPGKVAQAHAQSPVESKGCSHCGPHSQGGQAGVQGTRRVARAGDPGVEAARGELGCPGQALGYGKCCGRTMGSGGEC